MPGPGPCPDAGPTTAVIEAKILAMLAGRHAASTLCPSEVARALAADGDAWRAWMPRVRKAAQALAATGRIVVTRGGVPVDALAGGGPIRLGLPCKA